MVIRISALPEEASPVPSEFLAIDGASVRKTTIQAAVNSAAPVASQAEAEAGANNVKRMTPLTVKQSIASEVGDTVASAAQGALANTALQPGDVNDLVFQTIADMKAFSPVTGRVGFLNAAGREGNFKWTAGDFSAQIAADTLNGIYVKADAVAASVGAWVRQGAWIVFGVSVLWFGAVADGVTDDSDAIQAAFDFAKGRKVVLGAGIHGIAKHIHLRKGTTLVGAGPDEQWNSGVASGEGSGLATIIEAIGAGVGSRWTDIDGSDPATFKPGLIPGAGCSLEGFTVRNIGATAWDAGIYLPGSSRVAIRRVNTIGKWDKGGLYIDSTWGVGNTTLTTLHPEIEQPGGCFEITAQDCWFRGRGGLTVQGTTRNPDSFTDAEWVWNPAGTSDLNFMNCRFESDRWYIDETTRKARGHAYLHDAATKSNPSKVGQGHFFNACYFRTASLHSIKLDRSNRDMFINCYGETNVSTFTPRSRIEVSSNTGIWSMINDAIVAPLWKDGVELVSDLTLLLPEHAKATKLYYHRYTGLRVSSSSYESSVESTTGPKIVGKNSTGGWEMGKIDSTTGVYSQTWIWTDTFARPVTDGTHQIGSTAFALLKTITHSLQLKDGGISVPGTAAGFANIYIDPADGDLKIKFGDGVVKTIVTDT